MIRAMKNITVHFAILMAFLLGTTIIAVSCGKEKEEEVVETIDYSLFHGDWVVVESNEPAADGLFVMNDVPQLGFAYGKGGEIDDIGWSGFRGENRYLFNAMLDMTTNRIFDIYGYIVPLGSPPKGITYKDEEYFVTKLDQNEMVLNRVLPSNNKGRVVLKRQLQ